MELGAKDVYCTWKRTWEINGVAIEVEYQSAGAKLVDDHTGRRIDRLVKFNRVFAREVIVAP